MNEGIQEGNALLNNRKNKTPIVFDILLLGFVLFFSAIVIFYYYFAFSPIKGNSMLNTIEWGQSVLLKRHNYTLERGDIITIDVPTDTENPHILIKRVVGLEGDKILFVRSEDNIYVDMYICKAGSSNFELAEEPYILERMKWEPKPDSEIYQKVSITEYISAADITDIDITKEYTDKDKKAIQKQITNASYTVKSGEVFFLGDNRNNSNDSRHYGSQPKNMIIGKVIKIFKENSSEEKFFRFLFNNYESA